MIQRFEDEYPETRIQTTDATSVHSFVPSVSPPASSMLSNSITSTNITDNISDDDEPKALRSRHNSDVSLAARALSLEEGRLHRLGHRVRTELINPSRPGSSDSHANLSGTMDSYNVPEHLMALREKYLNYSGEELRHMTEQVGWEKAFDNIVDNAEQLKRLEIESPEEFRLFRETQIAALKNRNPDINPVVDVKDDFAVED